MIRHDSGLELLAAPANPEDYEEIKAGQVEKIIKLLTKFHDRVIIDCQSMTINETNIEIFQNSLKIFIVIMPCPPSAMPCASPIHFKTGISDNRIEFILNRYEKKAVLSVEEAETLEGSVHAPATSTRIHVVDQRGPASGAAGPRLNHIQNLISFCKKLMNKSNNPGYREQKPVLADA